jgi:hypothetical protein
MPFLRPSARFYFRTGCRVASLLACGFALLIYLHVLPIAAKAYNDLCQGQGVNFASMGFPDQLPLEHLAALLAINAVPILLARSSPLIVANLAMCLIVALRAGALPSTAGNTPFECFSSFGNYEDRTAGIGEFHFWAAFFLYAAVAFLLIDWAAWAVRKAIGLWAAAASWWRSRSTNEPLR